MVSKKLVIVLVIIAIILASVSVAYTVTSSGKSIPTNVPGTHENSGAGKVGVTILPNSDIEDKNIPK
jgi:hypothetical protein